MWFIEDSSAEDSSRNSCGTDRDASSRSPSVAFVVWLLKTLRSAVMCRPPPHHAARPCSLLWFTDYNLQWSDESTTNDSENE